MSIKITTKVWEDSQHKGSALLALLSIADQSSDDGIAWPGLNTVAKRARVSRTTVRVRLDDLALSDELFIHARQGRTHYYIVKMALTPEQFAAAVATLNKKRGGETEYVPGKMGRPDKTGYLVPKTGVIGGGQPGLSRSVTNPQETPSAGDPPKPRKQNLIGEAIYFGLYGRVWQKGDKWPGILNRMTKAVREVGGTPALVLQYYADLRQKGMTPTKDSEKLAAAIHGMIMDASDPLPQAVHAQRATADLERLMEESNVR